MDSNLFGGGAHAPGVSDKVLVHLFVIVKWD